MRENVSSTFSMGGIHLSRQSHFFFLPMLRLIMVFAMALIILDVAIGSLQKSVGEFCGVCPESYWWRFPAGGFAGTATKSKKTSGGKIQKLQKKHPEKAVLKNKCGIIVGGVPQRGYPSGTTSKHNVWGTLIRIRGVSKLAGYVSECLVSTIKSLSMSENKLGSRE